MKRTMHTAIRKTVVLAAPLFSVLFMGPAFGQVSDSKRAWGPEQVTGKPDTFRAGDTPTAWASGTPDGQNEWLVLEYQRTVLPKAVKIFETFNPGAVHKVSLFNADGQEVEVWSGKDPTSATEEMGVSEIAFEATFKTNRIKIYLDSKSVAGWNEIDAVALVDEKAEAQWVQRAEASSTFAEPSQGESGTALGAGTRAWGPEQATGKPDTHQVGDIQTAWASRGPDDGPEWLELEFGEKVYPTAVLVYETFNPGAVHKATVFTLDGEEVPAWEGEDPTPVGSGAGISVLPLNAHVKTQQVKLYIDSSRVPGWNEIDAVGLLSAKGKIQWAKAARASTTFAELSQQGQTLPSEDAPASGDEPPKIEVRDLNILQGQVYSAEDRTPVPNARIYVVDNTEGHLFYQGVNDVTVFGAPETVWWFSEEANQSRGGQATTDEAGGFKLEGLRAGTYNVMAVHPTLGVTLLKHTVQFPETSSVEIALDPPTFIEGTLKGWSGDALRQLQLVSSLAGRRVHAQLQLEPDANGSFRTGQLPAFENWQLTAYEFVRPRNFAAPLIEYGFTIQPGETAHIDLDLESAPEVAGRVVGPEGKPLADVSVVLHALDDMRLKRGAVTDTSGEYSIGGLTPGRYRLEANRWLPRTGPG